MLGEGHGGHGYLNVRAPLVTTVVPKLAPGTAGEPSPSPLHPDVRYGFVATSGPADADVGARSEPVAATGLLGRHTRTPHNASWGGIVVSSLVSSIYVRLRSSAFIFDVAVQVADVNGIQRTIIPSSENREVDDSTLLLAATFMEK